MIKRRDLLIGGSCLLGAGAGYLLTPRKRVSLLGKGKLDSLIPRKFGDWASRDVSDLVAPKDEDSLASKIYNEQIERIYVTGQAGQLSNEAQPGEVMMLLAHGDTQSNELQLHRPEVCYPAFGYEVSRNAPFMLKVAPGVTVPARRLVASAPGRRENIIYWSRLGEYMPTDGGQQRMFRVRTALDGYVADGLLARFSAFGDDSAQAWTMLEGFISALVMAVPPEGRRGLLGTSRANALGPSVTV